METIDIIHKRRSIRQFNNKLIAEEDIHKILSAGMTSPSAMNKQPWKFIIINDNKIKEKITKISQYAQMATQSPMSILVCGDTEKSHEDCWIIDCSACIQNMLLASCSLNIGSVWTGISSKQREDFISLFNLPTNIIPHSLIIFGYSDKDLEYKDYFDSSKIHINKW